MAIVMALLLAQDGPELVRVQMSKARLYKEPNDQAPKAGIVNEGHEFKVLAWEGSFAKVEFEGGVAYIKKGSLVAKKDYVPPPSSATEGTSGGVALATKGFTPQMEADHKKKNNLQAAYAKLDRMEKNPDPMNMDERVGAFAKAGGLKP